ncbi:MAG: tetratricopeptide repeat protein [Bacteroidia bacterium]|nr:tetratricopeptide repeat protein [Bacteroidia bacterium]
MKTIGLIIILSAYILIINGYCQSIDNNVVFSVTDYKRLGKGAEKAGDYRAAIKYYELYNSVKSNNAEVNFRLGELYRNIREYRQAKECYYKTWNQSPLKYPEALYYYGIMLKMDGQYAEAKTMLEKFIKTPVDDKKILDLKIKAREELTNFDKINILVQKNENVTITMLDSSINRAHTELSPIPFNDSLLIFSSVRPSNAGDIQNNVAEFYTAHRKDNNWTSDDINVLPFNNSGENTCNGTFSKDGNHFYFTRCEILKSNKANCELFVSIKSGDEWVAPVKLDKMINMSGFTNTQPSVGIDFKT